MIKRNNAVDGQENLISKINISWIIFNQLFIQWLTFLRK